MATNVISHSVGYYPISNSHSHQLRTTSNDQPLKIRIADLAKKVFLGLLCVGSAVTLGGLIGMVTTGSPLSLTVTLVGSLALKILLLLEAIPRLAAYLPPTPKYVYEYIQSGVWDILAKLTCIALYPLDLTKWDPKEKVKSEQIPILLVHGFLGHGSNWVYQRLRLKEAGLGPVFTINLGWPIKKIEAYAQMVKRKVEHIKEQTGHEKIILIGHSMGGLISELYATKLAPPKSVPNVITLGTPQHGSKWPHTLIGSMTIDWLGPAAKQMTYQSNFIKKLTQEMHKTTDTNFYHITSKMDPNLDDPPFGTLPFPTSKNEEYETVPHVGYLFSDDVGDKIVSYIQKRHPFPKSE